MADFPNKRFPTRRNRTDSFVFSRDFPMQACFKLTDQDCNSCQPSPGQIYFPRGSQQFSVQKGRGFHREIGRFPGFNFPRLNLLTYAGWRTPSSSRALWGVEIPAPEGRAPDWGNSTPARGIVQGGAGRRQLFLSFPFFGNSSETRTTTPSAFLGTHPTISRLGRQAPFGSTTSGLAAW